MARIVWGLVALVCLAYAAWLAYDGWFQRKVRRGSGHRGDVNRP